mgnify:CR=1 FL=1
MSYFGGLPYLYFIDLDPICRNCQHRDTSHPRLLYPFLPIFNLVLGEIVLDKPEYCFPILLDDFRAYSSLAKRKSK